MSLTRGGVVLSALIVVVVLTATPNNAPIFIVLAFFLGLIIINGPFARLAVRGIMVRRDHVTHAKEGSDMQVRLRVTNRTRSDRLLLRLFDRGPSDGAGDPVQVPLLPGGATKEVAYRCPTGRRGVYRFTHCAVESSSPFGLIASRRVVKAESQLVVYPLYYELMGAAFPFHKSHSGLTAAPGSRPGEGASFFGLREYRYGDPIRKIHWPSTVRTRTVMLKEFEEDMHSSVTILLDTFARDVKTIDGDSNLEVAIRVAASMANHTLVSGHPTSLVAYDGAAECLRTDDATGDLTPVLDGLARLVSSTLKAVDLIDAAARSATRRSNWVVVLLRPRADTLERLLHARALGVEIVAVTVDWRTPAETKREANRLAEVGAFLHDAHIPIIQVAHGCDIQATLSRNLELRQ